MGKPLDTCALARMKLLSAEEKGWRAKVRGDQRAEVVTLLSRLQWVGAMVE